MSQGAEFIENAAEGPHITSKHIKTEGYSLTPDSCCVTAQSRYNVKPKHVLHHRFLDVFKRVLFVQRCWMFQITEPSFKVHVYCGLPLIIVRLVVPYFWSHIIRGTNVCMSVGLWAATTNKQNILKRDDSASEIEHTSYNKKIYDLCSPCLFRIHAEPKSPSLIVALSVRKIFCVKRRNDLTYHNRKNSHPFQHNIVH